MIRELQEKNFKLIGIGEVMLRLSPVGGERISYSETFEKKAGGSELNVVSGVSMLGLRTGIITKLPKNEIGKFVKLKIRYSGTSDDFVIYDRSPGKRLGVYYYEGGAYPRLPVVCYDRAASSFVNFRKEELPDSIYSSANVFHTSGISLALDKTLRENIISIMRKFHECGALISFDVNYRATLWSEEEAKSVIEEILPLVSILFISEETLRRMFAMTGTLEEIHKDFSKRYPNVEIIASTQRRVKSPKKHDFGSLVYDCREDIHYSDAPYCDIDVVDRIGSGDAYVAGALYGLIKHRSIVALAKYGDAMAALKNTVMGDMTECDLGDIERIISAHESTGPKSEMQR